MLKNIAQLAHVIGGRLYHFLCDHDAPLPDVKEALFQYQKYVGSIEDAVKEQQEKAKQEADAKVAEAQAPVASEEPAETEEPLPEKV